MHEACNAIDALPLPCSFRVIPHLLVPALTSFPCCLHSSASALRQYRLNSRFAEAGSSPILGVVQASENKPSSDPEKPSVWPLAKGVLVPGLAASRSSSSLAISFALAATSASSSPILAEAVSASPARLHALALLASWLNS